MIAANELRFEQQRLDLRADHDRLDALQRLNQAVHLPRIAEWLREIRSNPVPQILRLADIDHAASAVLEQVHAWRFRDVRQQSAVGDGARARHTLLGTPRSRARNRLQLIKRREPRVHRLAQQRACHQAGDAGVGARPVLVPGMAGNCKALRHRMQGWLAQARHQSCCQRQGAEMLVDNRIAADPLQLLIEEGDVEGHVMSNDHGSLQPLQDGIGNLAEGRSIIQTLVIDACQLGDIGRHPAPRLAKRLPLLNDLPVRHSHEGDLDDALPARLQTRRLDVEDNELLERRGRRDRLIRQKPGAVRAQRQVFVLRKDITQERPPQRWRASRTENMGNQEVLARSSTVPDDERFRALNEAREWRRRVSEYEIFGEVVPLGLKGVSHGNAV